MSNESRVLTCVYCGHEYPQDTPAAGAQVLTDHIRVCAKHPLRKAESDIALLRSALVGWIGASTCDELTPLKSVVSLMPESADKRIALAAIEALLATAPAVTP